MLVLWLLLMGCPGPECETAADCPADDLPCTSAVCDAGACGQEDDDALIPPQAADGDCRREVCLGGAVTSAPDDTEVPDDGFACTVDTCSGGAPLFTADDTACDDETATCVSETCAPAAQNTDDGSGCRVVPEDTACDDGNACTTDTCAPASGDATTGCVLAPTTTRPQIAGNCQAESCTDGVETSLADDADVPVTDADGVACTAPDCDAGVPVEDPIDARCDDGFDCTVGICDPVEGCFEDPDDGQCPEPGEFCRPDEATDASGCVDVDTCPSSERIDLNVAVEGDTSGYADDGPLGCATGAHPDRAFQILVGIASDLTVTVTPLDGQGISVALVEVTGSTCGRELACAAAAPGEAATFEVRNLDPTFYAIVVDGNGATPQDGAFTLTTARVNTAVTEGALVIDELMLSLDVLAETNAQYVEIRNPHPWFVSTYQMTLADGGSSSFVRDPITLTPLVVPPGGQVLGVRSLDPDLNGGLEPDFELGGNPWSNTDPSTFTLQKGALEIDQVDMSAAGFPAPVADQAFQLCPGNDHLDNDAYEAWIVTPETAAFEYRSGVFGTPGAPNVCPE